MDASLEIITSDNKAQRRVELGADQIRVGRSSRCDIRLPTRSVSGHHLTLRREGSGWVVVDERSTNGTKVNGAALDPDTPRPLEAGDEIDLSEVLLRFEAETHDDILTLQETGTLARQLVSDMLLEATDDDMARIEARGPAVDETVQLEDTLTRAFIGSSHDAMLTLAELDAPRLLELTRLHDGFGVRPVDEAGRDRLALNGDPLTESTPLSDGDIITAGHYTLTFYDPLESILLDLDDAALAPPSAAAPASVPAPDDGGPAVEPTSTNDAADSAAASDPRTPARDNAAPSSGLSTTERIILAVALLLMAAALAVVLTVFNVI